MYVNVLHLSWYLYIYKICLLKMRKKVFLVGFQNIVHHFLHLCLRLRKGSEGNMERQEATGVKTQKNHSKTAYRNISDDFSIMSLIRHCGTKNASKVSLSKNQQRADYTLTSNWDDYSLGMKTWQEISPFQSFTQTQAKIKQSNKSRAFTGSRVQSTNTLQHLNIPSLTLLWNWYLKRETSPYS